MSVLTSKKLDLHPREVNALWYKNHVNGSLVGLERRSRQLKYVDHRLQQKTTKCVLKSESLNERAYVNQD